VAGVLPAVPKSLAGRYHLVKLLARGGMAEVWEGWDEVLDRPVAVKILMAHLAGDATLQERFRREAVTAARLVHPGIVAVFDAGIEPVDGGPMEWSRGGLPLAEQGATAFMVMELVRGETLKDLIARASPLPTGVAVAIASQVASALGYAHSQGLVHRDVKPANVLLSDEGRGAGRVKVTDFGIAKVTAAAGADLTATGTIIGTPKYLSPEQVKGLEPDARADLYSLGIVLFEMLTGKPPFVKETDMATALARVHELPPRVDEIRPELPAGLGDLLEELLAPEPAHRVASAAALCQSLAAFGGTDEPFAAWSAGARLGGGTGPLFGAATEDITPGADGPTLGGRPTLGADSPTPGAGRPDRAVLAPDRPPAATSEAAGRPGPDQGLALEPAERRPPAARGRLRGAAAAGWRDRQAWRTVSAVVGTLVVAGGVVVASLVRAGGGGGSPSGAGGPASLGRSAAYPLVAISRVSELTEGGNRPNDHLGELRYLTDGNPRTAWESDVYDGPHFGGWGGFGLVMQLRSERALHQLQVLSPMQGWSAQTFVQARCQPSLGQWGQPTSTLSGIHGDATFSLGGRRGGCVLLWMTDPGPGRQAVVQELSLR